MDDYICADCYYRGVMEEFLADSDNPTELVEIFEGADYEYCCPNCGSVDIKPYEIS